MMYKKGFRAPPVAAAAAAKQELFHEIFTACFATVNYVNK